MLQVPLPEGQFVSEEERGDIKEWVLAISLNHKIDAVLDKDSRGCFVGALLNPKTGETSQPCVLTGYPVLDQGVSMSDGKVASRETWNQFVVAVKTAHREPLTDVLRFLGRWCAAPQNPSYAFA